MLSGGMPTERPATTVSAYFRHQPMQRFAHRHGADAEGIRQALDRHRTAGFDAAVQDQLFHWR